MAQHTITISDQPDGGITILIEGDSALDSSPAGTVARHLAGFAKAAAAKASDCQCPRCMARRLAESNESKPTLH
ncbi:hypothetical protein RXE51_005966 [Pseudomonas aeruginosa]|nr:hypothetical protein [Pseudomonas aeruginosa]